MKQKYQKPVMRAIELQQRPTLLEGSGEVRASRHSYNTVTEETWN